MKPLRLILRSAYYRFLGPLRRLRYSIIAKSADDSTAILYWHAFAAGAWSACPRCGEEHPDGQGKTVGGRWNQLHDEPPGVDCGFRLFLCNGCGSVLEEDVSQ